MSSIRGALGTHFSPFRPRLAVFAILAVLAIACAPVAARAGEAGWRVELGSAFRRLYGIGDMSEVVGGAGGIVFGIHVVRAAGGLGARVEAGLSSLRTAHADILGIPFLAQDPVPQPVGFEQALDWWAVGPSWCFPLRKGRVDVYVLGGAATVDRGVRGKDYSSGYVTFNPTWLYGYPGGGQSAPVPIFIAGTSWCGGRVPVWRLRFGAEVGCDLQVVGKGTIWDEPPVVLEGNQYVTRTRSVSMGGAALRFGLNCVGWR